MGYLSEFLDSAKYGAAQSTAENAKRDLENMDKLLSKRAITEQTYEEEAAKKRAIYDTASENALKYAESLNTSKLQQSGLPQETIDSLTRAQKTQLSYFPEPPKVEATGRRWDMSGPTPTLIEAPAEVAAQAAPEPVSRGRQMVQEQESRPKTHNEIMAALPTEGDREEYKRVIIEKDKAAKLNKAIQYVMQAYPPEEQKNALEMYKEQINLPYAGMDIRRMEERPIFKTAVETFGQNYQKNQSVLASLRGQLERAKMIADPGEKKLFLQTEIPKMLNTIAVSAPDAVGVEEGRRIMAELQKYTSTPIWEWASLAQDRGFISAFTADPDAFLNKVEALYKVSAKINNEKTNAYYQKLGGKGLQDAGGFFLDTNIGKGKDSPAAIEGFRTGEIKTTPALIKRFPEDTSISAPAPNQSMSRPLKNGTVAPTGVRLFGPAPNPFLLSGD